MKIILINFSLFTTVTTKTNGDEDVWSQLIHLMDKSTSTKRSFRRSEDIYRNRIRNDVKDLDVLSSEEVISGYHYLYSRYHIRESTFFIYLILFKLLFICGYPSTEKYNTIRRRVYFSI